jgi:MFS family permease
MADHPYPAAPAVSSRAWRLLALMTALNVLNFVDRQLIASLAPMLIADLQLSRAQIGLLVGFAFVVFYTVMGMLLGAAADRVSRPKLIAAGLTLWSLMTAASGLARNFAHLALPRMLVGVGEATLTPAALSMLGDVFPAGRLALATGIYYTGIPLGTACSLLVAGWLAPRYGWRSCFYVLGFVGVGFALLVWMLRDPRDATTRSRAQDAAGGGAAPPATRIGIGYLAATLWRTIVRVPSYGLAILGGALLAYGSAAALHAITWLVQERGFPFATAAFAAGIIAILSGLIGNLSGGWFADLCRRRWQAGRLWSLVLMTLFTTPFAVTLYYASPASPLFYVCWFVASAAATAYFGPLFAVVQEVSPVRIRSTTVAFALLGMNLLGVGPGPWITGMIGDASSLTHGLLVSLAVAFISIVPFVVAARRYARDVERAQRVDLLDAASAQRLPC